jgi:hypothetical protein
MIQLSNSSWHYTFNKATEGSWFKFFEVNYRNACPYFWATLGNILMLGFWGIVCCSVALGIPEAITYKEGYYTFSELPLMLVIMAVTGQLFCMAVAALLAIGIILGVFIALLLGVFIALLYVCETSAGVVVEKAPFLSNIGEAYRAYEEKYCPRINWKD